MNTTPSPAAPESLPMIHIGRKVPKGFEELPGSIHLGKGIWAFRTRPIVSQQPHD